MTTLRALATGAGLAVGFLAALLAFGRGSGWTQCLALAPLVALVSLALRAPSEGWRRRLARGLLGAVLAAGASVGIVRASPELFPYPADQGAGLYLAILALLAALPAFTAAAAASRACGRGLAVGFAAALAVPLLLHDGPGVPLLLGVGTLIGAAVAVLPIGRRRASDSEA